MTATALLKFRQLSSIGLPGQGLLVDDTDPVTIENSDNSGVGSFRISLVYAEPGGTHVINPGITPPIVLADGNGTPLATLNPDPGLHGCYRIMLEVWSGTNFTGTKDTDIRDIGVLTPNKRFLKPPMQKFPDPLPLIGEGRVGEKPGELNFFGQNYGWSGPQYDGTSYPFRLLNAALEYIDSFSGGGGSQTLSQTLGFGTHTAAHNIDVTHGDFINFESGTVGVPLGGIQANIDPYGYERIEFRASALDAYLEFSTPRTTSALGAEMYITGGSDADAAGGGISLSGGSTLQGGSATSPGYVTLAGGNYCTDLSNPGSSAVHEGAYLVVVGGTALTPGWVDVYGILNPRPLPQPTTRSGMFSVETSTSPHSGKFNLFWQDGAGVTTQLTPTQAVPLSAVLLVGNTTGARDIVIDSGQKVDFGIGFVHNDSGRLHLKTNDTSGSTPGSVHIETGADAAVAIGGPYLDLSDSTVTLEARYDIAGSPAYVQVSPVGAGGNFHAQSAAPNGQSGGTLDLYPPNPFSGSSFSVYMTGVPSSPTLNPPNAASFSLYSSSDSSTGSISFNTGSFPTQPGGSGYASGANINMQSAYSTSGSPIYISAGGYDDGLGHSNYAPSMSLNGGNSSSPGSFSLNIPGMGIPGGFAPSSGIYVNGGISIQNFSISFGTYTDSSYAQGTLYLGSAQYYDPISYQSAYGGYIQTQPGSASQGGGYAALNSGYTSAGGLAARLQVNSPVDSTHPGYFDFSNGPLVLETLSSFPVGGYNGSLRWDGTHLYWRDGSAVDHDLLAGGGGGGQTLDQTLGYGHSILGSHYITIDNEYSAGGYAYGYGELATGSYFTPLSGSSWATGGAPGVVLRGSPAFYPSNGADNQGGYFKAYTADPGKGGDLELGSGTSKFGSPSTASQNAGVNLYLSAANAIHAGAVHLNSGNFGGIVSAPGGYAATLDMNYATATQGADFRVASGNFDNAGPPAGRGSHLSFSAATVSAGSDAQLVSGDYTLYGAPYTYGGGLIITPATPTAGSRTTLKAGGSFGLGGGFSPNYGAALLQLGEVQYGVVNSVDTILKAADAQNGANAASLKLYPGGTPSSGSMNIRPFILWGNTPISGTYQESFGPHFESPYFMQVDTVEYYNQGSTFGGEGRPNPEQFTNHGRLYVTTRDWASGINRDNESGSTLQPYPMIGTAYEPELWYVRKLVGTGETIRTQLTPAGLNEPAPYSLTISAQYQIPLTDTGSAQHSTMVDVDVVNCSVPSYVGALGISLGFQTPPRRNKTFIVKLKNLSSNAQSVTFSVIDGINYSILLPAGYPVSVAAGTTRIWTFYYEQNTAPTTTRVVGGRYFMVSDMTLAGV